MKSDKFLAKLRENNHKRAHLILTDDVMQQIRDYHTQGYTKRDVGMLLGVGIKVIRRCFREMGLQGRDGAQNKLTKRQLTQEFTSLFRAQQLESLIRSSFAKGMSAVDVGHLCGRNYSTIIGYARLLGIPIQTRSQAAAKRRGSLSIAGTLREILDGELLGDGCITKPQTPSAAFSYGTPRGAYLYWLAGLVGDCGLEGHVNGPYPSPGRQPVFSYTSKRYPELVDVYRRWYPNGTKCIPQDIQITPTLCRHWYVGDGSFKREKSWHSPSLTLATMCFSREDVERLCTLLEVHFPGVHVGKHPNGPTVFFPASAANAFCAYIGPCPEPIQKVYGYKWGLPNALVGSQISFPFLAAPADMQPRMRP